MMLKVNYSCFSCLLSFFLSLLLSSKTMSSLSHAFVHHVLVTFIKSFDQLSQSINRSIYPCSDHAKKYVNLPHFGA